MPTGLGLSAAGPAETCPRTPKYLRGLQLEKFRLPFGEPPKALSLRIVHPAKWGGTVKQLEGEAEAEEAGAGAEAEQEAEEAHLERGAEEQRRRGAEELCEEQEEVQDTEFE